ncbi:lysophospholipid acyltransferase family protein [Imbroritus primus]|uniref:lysophospholipid acyltransferase family protein n=1 Tax=Imbroritus primus TaxID=3058603 RepID=UPI003D161D45
MIWLKKARLAGHIVWGVTICAVVFPWSGHAARHRHIRRWSQRLLELCGVRLEVRELAPLARGRNDTGGERGFMVIANHISWLDIYLINAWQPVRFVAKSEIRNWPVIGWLCAKTGTFFIDRNRKRDARRMMHDLVEHMQHGDIVCVFPEGTTGDGRDVLPFHANLMQAPLHAGVPVQPVGLRYLDEQTGEWTPAPAYIGELTLLQSLDAILRAPPIRARLTVGEPLPTDERTRRELAELGSDAIRRLL